MLKLEEPETQTKIKIMGSYNGEKERFVRGHSGARYDFNFEQGIGYTYTPKNQGECDDICRRKRLIKLGVILPGGDKTPEPVKYKGLSKEELRVLVYKLDLPQKDTDTVNILERLLESYNEGLQNG
jgi:hypothetical protein